MLPSRLTGKAHEVSLIVNMTIIIQDNNQKGVHYIAIGLNLL